MKLSTFAVIAFVLLFLFAPVAPVSAQDSPLSGGPVDDITADFEALSDYFGLGAVVALVVVAARMLKLPDGWGGYAGLGVGIFAYVASCVLPEASRDVLFEAMDHAARLLMVVLGSQVSHVSLKYSRLDRLWKRGDGA